MDKRWILALAASVASASAQDFPVHPVRIVVPWPASGNVDITARTVAPAMSEALGQQVIVENRAGAAGRMGTTAVAKSPADGYALLLGSSLCGAITLAIVARPLAFSWLSVPADETIVFDGEHDTKWRRAFGKLNIDPLLLSGAAGHA